MPGRTPFGPWWRSSRAWVVPAPEELTEEGHFLRGGLGAGGFAKQRKQSNARRSLEGRQLAPKGIGAPLRLTSFPLEARDLRLLASDRVPEFFR